MLVLTDSNFDNEIQKSEVPVLVDFYADWCVPCKSMSPIIEEVAKEMAGRLVVGKVDVDNNMNTAGKFGIMGIPTFILFKQGKEIYRSSGYQEKTVIVKAISQVI